MSDGVPISLEALRRAQLEGLRRWFPAGARVLELGGADGFLASILASWGCSVESIDVASSRPGWGAATTAAAAAAPQGKYHPVLLYDGEHIPFDSASFDVVFSSNVLEHVERLPGLLADVARVLVPGGLTVHVMPNPAWRFWTIVTHYPHYLAKGLYVGTCALLGLRATAARIPEAAAGGGGKVGKAFGLARKAAFPAAHGNYANALVELATYCRASWRLVFEDNGFELVETGDDGIFATLTLYLPLSMDGRRSLARNLGATHNTYVARPARPAA